MAAGNVQHGTGVTVNRRAIRWPVFRAGLPAVLLACGLATGGRAANWIDRLPVDEPVLLAEHAAAPALPQPPQREAPAVGQGAAGPASAGAPGSAGVLGTVAALPARLADALWAVSTMLGFSAPAIRQPPDGEAVSGGEDPAGVAPPAVPVVAPSSPARLAAARPDVTGPAADDEVDPALLANFVYDRAERRPDGSFFVPKTLQRLFNVRTVRATAADVPVTIRLSGHIVPNARTHGIVQASQTGRFEPPETGLPVLGDKVVEGQLLGLVAPAVGAVDRQLVQREVARLTADIRTETENLELLKQYSFVLFRDSKIAQAEQQLAGLRREREVQLQLLQLHEPLRAPTSGVIALAAAVAGRMVNPGEVVFEIVDPADLWVEAIAADPAAAADATRARSATALTPEGQALRLIPVGGGAAATPAASPILFRIEAPPEGLLVGRPVTVTVRSETRARHGMPVSREAVTIGTDGVQEVWEQTAPEVFLPHPVRTQDIDGATVLVMDPLADGVHLVVRGARLMAQLQ